MTPVTDEAGLIRKIVEGRRDLFGDLIAPHLTPLSRTVHATIGSHPDVEDIVQQAAMKAFVHLGQFRFQASFRTWFIRIGLNEARQWRRRNTSTRFFEFPVASLSDLPVADRRPSPLNECEKSESIGQMRAALDRLPEKYRIVIDLRDLKDLSITEVAGELGLSVPAVKSRHLRARKKVAKLLGCSSQSRKVPGGGNRLSPTVVQ